MSARMEAKVRSQGGPVTVRENYLDWGIRQISPIHGNKRFQARINAVLGQQILNRGAYRGAGKGSKWAKEWTVSGGDADADLLEDLDTLRSRSQDLYNNNALASGAIKTKCTHVVGPGLKLNARVNAEALGLDPDQAGALNRLIESEFALFARNSDICGKQHFGGQHDLVFRSRLIAGDVFVLRRYKPMVPSPYGLRLQLIEGHRCTNPDNIRDTEEISAGIASDADGTPIAYHFSNRHPGSALGYVNTDWSRVPARGASGLRNVLHVHKMDRIGQTRGVPDLAPVIELIKQLGRYTESEIMAAVVSSMFTVFVKTEGGGLDLEKMPGTTKTDSTEDYELGNGAMVGLAEGESVDFANPSRPNTAFDPFVLSMLRQIAPSLELPVEVLIKHFTSSYSAARAALEELHRYVRCERELIVRDLCNPVLEWFWYEAVALGRIPAPGFFADPMIRDAYMGAEWIGPAKGVIDGLKEAKEQEAWMDMGAKTLDYVIRESTGQDPDHVYRQRIQHKAREDRDGLAPAPTQPDPPQITEEAA